MRDSRFSSKVGHSPCNHTISELIVMRLNYRATMQREGFFSVTRCRQLGTSSDFPMAGVPSKLTA